jgi:hypothetical protein
MKWLGFAYQRLTVMLAMQDVVGSAIDAPNSAANTEAAIRQTSPSLLSFIVPLGDIHQSYRFCCSLLLYAGADEDAAYDIELGCVLSVAAQRWKRTI